MKRTASINLSHMRKGFSIKPISVAVTSVFLTACGEPAKQSTVYTSEQDCIDQNPNQIAECQTAYQHALTEAEKTAPKYQSRNDCEYEFGANQCTQSYQSGGGSFFMPFMAGYMISNLLSPRPHYSQPLFTSYSPYSNNRYQWMGADGYRYGDIRSRNIRTNNNSFKPKPVVNKTISRGGFGSSVRAKSAWGSSSKGWGGGSKSWGG